MEQILIASQTQVTAPEQREKLEMDRSYQVPGSVTNESGVFSNESADSKLTGDSSWNFWENEITDPNAFMLPILHSSNLNGNENVIYCSLSSIDELSLVSKGKNSFKVHKIRSYNLEPIKHY